MLLAAILLEFETSARYDTKDALKNVYCSSTFLKEISRGCDLFVGSDCLRGKSCLINSAFFGTRVCLYVCFPTQSLNQ